MSNKLIGKGLARLEGPLKVQGKVRFAADFPHEKLAYAVGLGSTIASGTIKSIDTTAARKYKGVLQVFTHENCPKLNITPGSISGPSLLSKQDTIWHQEQYVALVVANTFEAATEACRLIKVVYDEKAPIIKYDDKRAEVSSPEKTHMGSRLKSNRGDADGAFEKAPVKIDAKYSTPSQNHNQMETHSIIANWKGDKLTIYDGSQNPAGERATIAGLFGVPESNVRVVSKFVGGGFGGKSGMWPHISLTVMAARELKRPVKFVTQRKHAFGSVGRRSATEQRIALGAERDGTLKAIIHEGKSDTAIKGDFIEQFTISTPMLYACESVRVGQELIRLNRNVPTFMRAPGEATGVWVLECAMDELAHELGMDPIKLRMKNYAYKDPEFDREFSSKSLDKCYELGAQKIGWENRSATPGKVKRDGLLVGLGMASATRGAKHFNGSVSAIFGEDGVFVFKTSTVEQGTGSITVMTQIGADALDVPLSMVCFELGDTDFPKAPTAAGSATVTTIGNGVYAAAKELQLEFAKRLSAAKDSPMFGVPVDKFGFSDDKIMIDSNRSNSITYAKALKLLGLNQLEITHTTNFNDRENPYSMHGFGAHFAEVTVDPDLGILRVTKFVSAITCGRVMNEKTCKSQVEGAAVWGISMALHEETITDPRSGRIMNASFSGYHIAANADIPKIEAYLIDEEDKHIGALGAKGVGEIGMAGVPAAIANALFNATGKRVRDLPITPDKIMT